MPITEVVRVLARAEHAGGAFELLYDVSGQMLPDEQTLGWPAFWLRCLDREGVLREVLGPFPTEDEAVERAEGLGAGEFVAP
ncbi:MAG: hypothetical protein HKN46_05605 [Acidimicrobiia bacterium]|nr:hypothetical protein [Acidimicrobiia bacterium]